MPVWQELLHPCEDRNRESLWEQQGFIHLPFAVERARGILRSCLRDRQIFRKSHIRFIMGDPATASSSTVPPISGTVLVWLNILAFPVPCNVWWLGLERRHCCPQKK